MSTIPSSFSVTGSLVLQENHNFGECFYWNSPVETVQSQLRR